MPTETRPKEALLDYVVRYVEAHLNARAHWDTAPLSRWHLQGIRALAYLYAGCDTPLKQSGAVADSIREVYRVIREHSEPPDNRLTGQLAEAYALLAEANALDLLPGIETLLVAGAEPLAEKLRSYRYLTHFTASNTGTGTNHVAVYCCSVYRVGEVLGRADYRKLVRATWDRLAADQEPDGYWAETTGGPTTLYNNLTYCCAGRMARWTGDPKSHRAAQRGALFHRRFSYPDGSDVETIDGRCRYRPSPMLWGGFVQSETPEGRAFALRKLETFARLHPPEQARGWSHGETLALLCEDHRLWVEGPVGAAEWDSPYSVETLRVPGGVRRHGPWFVALQGIQHLPSASGGFTIDRTSLCSLWHARAGLVVNGSGEPGAHRAQSVRLLPMYKRQPDPVPERARLEMGRPGSDDPARIIAEYRGGTVRLEVRFVSETEAQLHVGVAVRDDRYPIPLTLQLEARRGDRVNGIEIGELPLKLSARELQGRLDTERFQIAFPRSGAQFLWPHDPHNPYELQKHKSPPEMYVSLLTLPVGPDGLRVTFRIP